MVLGSASENTTQFADRHLCATLAVAVLLCLLAFGSTASAAQAAEVRPNPAAGPTGLIVQGVLGGTIIGFDIDPDGNEGILSEFKGLADGTVQAAVETFDQSTGQILKILVKSETQDDFLTLGIAGNSVGLVEREHPVSLFHVQRTFHTINPLDGNKFNGVWTPPINQSHIITEVRRTRGSSNVAVYALDVSRDMTPVIFSSDVAANTFGPILDATDPDFNFETAPVIAYDGLHNRAFLGHAALSHFIVPPKIGMMDLATGAFRKVKGLGLGLINGIAVDEEDGIICTTTSFDAAVEFYHLNEETRFIKILPGADDSLFRGQHVEYDPVNKLFLVAQPFSSTGPEGSSSIQVYDTQGNFVESVDGLSFSGTSNVLPVHIALHPSQRTGFVDGPDLNDKQIQAFSY